MESPKHWIGNDLKIPQFNGVSDHLNDKQRLEVRIADLVINISEKNVEDVFKTIEDSNIGRSFVYKCIDNAFCIRPKKMEALFKLFCLVEKKYGYSEYETSSKILNKVLISSGIVENNSNIEVEKLEDIFGIFPKGSIERSIVDDDIDSFITLTSSSEFDPEKKIDVSKETAMYRVNGEKRISYIQLIALFGSLKCFKNALLNGWVINKDVNIYAIAGGNIEIIHLLAENDPTFYDECLEVSVKFHHNSLSDWLLNNYKCENICKFSCLCYWNHLAFHFFQLNDINVEPKNFENDLRVAAISDDVPSLMYIFQTFNINPNNKTYDLTPMQNAAIYGSLSAIKCLFEIYNCNPSQANSAGVTPLFYAIWNGRSSIVKYLIEQCGCDPNERGKLGRVALDYASGKGNLPLVKYLIEQCGCDPNERGYCGKTALHCASEKGNLPLVKYLIEQCCCDPNERDYCGKTALDFVSKEENLPLVKYLIERCGCDPKK